MQRTFSIYFNESK